MPKCAAMFLFVKVVIPSCEIAVTRGESDYPMRLNVVELDISERNIIMAREDVTLHGIPARA